MAMTQIFREILFQEPSSIFNKIMEVMNLVFSAILGISETFGKQNLEYSKFWNLNSKKQVKAKVPSRMGMLIAYTPSLIACLSFFWIFPNGGIRFFMLNSAIALHFFKRVLEVLFVHKYSGAMAMNSAITISSSYLMAFSSLIYIQHLTEGSSEPNIDLKYLGFIVFMVGIIGNFYYHFLLSNMRKKGENGYKIPKGGLFNLVICPHYLFEIVTFLGFSLISQTLFSFSSTIGTLFYLMGRSYATRKWYLSKFEDFPRTVKALIPFVF
ncbi:steroid 5-alpha-reductase DET2-like [Nicotiana tomentosiformis]|uniref:steroid 5-alpha-reductase DET2-like n=1 Tax=Nicotiana tomentosiformis TaxID=4098 RepID=UPI00051CA81A|nr:steroid 5-alpha-reductase DET2-like [Nicotiana tomentosiformis]